MSFNIALPRQRGKTTWAIRLAAKTGASLVVPTERDVVLATAKAKSLGLRGSGVVYMRHASPPWRTTFRVEKMP